jgi:hypothetical protein
VSTRVEDGPTIKHTPFSDIAVIEGVEAAVPDGYERVDFNIASGTPEVAYVCVKRWREGDTEPAISDVCFLRHDVEPRARCWKLAVHFHTVFPILYALRVQLRTFWLFHTASPRLQAS